MNYRHAYHAGNFSDVFKHVILIALIQSLSQKEKPFCYLDTHAGRGLYDLTSVFSEKTQEYQDGILKVRQQKNFPQLIKKYLEIIHEISIQNKNSSHTYPGSPLIARHLLRAKDRMLACELHEEEFQFLKNILKNDKQTAIHHMDGYLSMKAHLPPQEKRGIVLIDPPYEDTQEFARIVENLKAGIKRFDNGVFAIWYPIKEKKLLTHFYQNLKRNIVKPILAVELMIYDEIPNQLNGCGMIIINPPWQFEVLIKESMQWLWNCLSVNSQGNYQTFELK